MKKVIIEGKEYLLNIEECKRQGLLSETILKPISWKEWKELVAKKGICHYDITGYDNLQSEEGSTIRWWEMLSEKKAKAFAAFGKLLQLRDAWVGNWEPNYKDCKVEKYYLMNDKGHVSGGGGNYTGISHPLSFPTVEMRDEFWDCFKDLLEEAKELL